MSCPADIIENNNSTDAIFDRCLDTGSLAQHKGKSEATVWFTGPKAYTHQREAFIKDECGHVLRDARYLGPRLHNAQFLFLEKEARLQAATKAWCMYYKFWFRAVDVRFKVLVFRCGVWATLLSGLVSFCISD